MNIRAIVYATGVIGGILLTIGPFTRTGRVAPRWTRVALWMAGPASAAWGVLGFVLLQRLTVADLYRQAIDPTALLLQFKNMFAGIAIGILILLVSSGGLKRDRWQPRP